VFMSLKALVLPVLAALAEPDSSASVSTSPMWATVLAEAAAHSVSLLPAVYKSAVGAVEVVAGTARGTARAVEG
jgi:hypothetical protein